MRIIGLPKEIYQMFSEFREKYDTPIHRYEYLRKTYKVSYDDLSKEFGLELHFTDIVEGLGCWKTDAE